MRITVNDLAFEFPLYERTRAMDAVGRFISICRMLESVRCHAVERLVGTYIDMSKELFPSGTLHQIVQGITDKDDRRYFLSLLVNRESTVIQAKDPFIYKQKESLSCAAARDAAVVSLETDDGFRKNEISGELGNVTVRIKNISCEAHIDFYQEMLDLRIYEANDVKHKKDRNNSYGKGKVASPMDLSDEEAQILLDQAIVIKQRLYARKGNRNYAFQNTRKCTYHGYIADDLEDDILVELYKKKWD